MSAVRERCTPTGCDDLRRRVSTGTPSRECLPGPSPAIIALKPRLATSVGRRAGAGGGAEHRSARIQSLQAQLIAARRTPAELASLVRRVEANVRVNVARPRESLADQANLREVFQAMFPSGLTFDQR